MKHNINISCNHCGNKSSIPIKKSQFGQTITERCNYCGEAIPEIRVPNMLILTEEEHKTAKLTFVEVKETKQSCLKLIIEESEYNYKQIFIIGKDMVILGRKGVTSNADIQIDTNDLSMSREHVRIEKKQNGKYSIVDNFSSNGTFLNRRRLSDNEEIFIKNNCRINIGATEIIAKLFSQD